MGYCFTSTAVKRAEYDVEHNVLLSLAALNPTHQNFKTQNSISLRTRDIYRYTKNKWGCGGVTKPLIAQPRQLRNSGQQEQMTTACIARYASFPVAPYEEG